MKLFYEKYIKLAHIGKGANAHVYKVRHAELGYVRAIKILNEDIESKGERAYQSFLKECKTLLAIGNGAHPNIIRIYGPDLIDNHAIVEMDYVQGTTLDSYIKNKGFLDYEEVKIFIHDIVGALAYTHHDIYKFLMHPEEDDLQPDPNDGHKYVITPEKEVELVKKYGIAHNDLHSNNVMRRDYDGSFVLLDFGLAVQDGECIKSSRKSDGHPEYMAPEKFDSGDITPRSDVYSLGVLIYEALTGRPPFILDYDADGKVSYPALSKICNEHHNQTPPPIVSFRKSAFEKQIPGAVYERDYPEWLDEVIKKCLAKDPMDRYADAKELQDDINRHLKEDASKNTEKKDLTCNKSEDISTDDCIQEKIDESLDDALEHETVEQPKKRKMRWLLSIVSVILISGIIAGGYKYYTAQSENDQTGGVVKMAIANPDGILTQSSINTIDSLSQALKNETGGVELYTMVVDSIDTSDIDTYATDLFNRMGLGSADRNDGILFLVAFRNRQCVIRTGTGIEKTLTNDDCNRIMQTDIIPYMKVGKINEGVVEGVRGIYSGMTAANNNTHNNNTLNDNPPDADVDTRDVPKPRGDVRRPSENSSDKISSSLDTGYGTWTGEVKNGKPHGKGNIVFYSAHKIDRYSDVIADPGDYFEAVYENGQLVSGILFDGNGNKKNTIIP